MKNIADIYDRLKKDYVIKWYESEFELYFSSKHKEYKIYVSEDLVSIDKIKKIKIFKYELKYEVPISHTHFDTNKSTIDNVYKMVLFYLNRYEK